MDRLDLELPHYDEAALASATPDRRAYMVVANDYFDLLKETVRKHGRRHWPEDVQRALWDKSREMDEKRRALGSGQCVQPQQTRT